MNDSTHVADYGAVLDPHKRVRYTTGLVLGVDEFNQEQHHFLHHNREHQRQAHGYGTTSGLKVRVEQGTEPAQVVVDPGTAISPRGETLRVPRSQCAGLDEWLARNQEAVLDQLGSTPGSLSLYVVLGYRECETDVVPIPGEPCRTQEESAVASRLAEDFELALTLEAPDQAERDGIRRFGDFLSHLTLSDVPAEQATREDLLDIVRTLGNDAPPPAPERLVVAPDAFDELLQAVFRVWITEVRPQLSAQTRAATDGLLLLAQVEFDVEDDGAGGLKISGSVAIDEDGRPILLPTSLMHRGWRPPEHTAERVPFVPPSNLGITGPAVSRAAARKATAKKATAKKATAKKTTPKKATARKTTARKTTAKKTTAKKTTAKKTTAKKTTAKTARTTRRRTKKKPSGEGAES